MTHSGPTQLGTLLRRLRLASGLSQEQLAERSGLSARAISDLERGLRAQPRPETLRLLADALALGSEDRAALFQAARPDLYRSPNRVGTAHQPGNQLPVPPSPLIGREREVTELVSRLTRKDARLTTLSGTGGVGKTRLGIEAARQAAPSFPDGVVFVDLAPVTDSLLVGSAIAHALGIQESGAQSLDETLGIALLNRRLLLVLDNFEQVIAAAQGIATLLARAPELQILVTSRETLRVRGEHEFVVQPLEVPAVSESSDVGSVAGVPAVALFVERAQTVNPGFTLTEDSAPAVAEICRGLDGLPLAIELAASRVKYFPPSVLLEHLDRRLPVLTGGFRDLPLRQRTLRDTIAWSYDLLTPDEQALFRRLGVFAGGASIPAIEAVIPAAGALELDLLSGLASLVDKNLVRERLDHRGTPRFSMLETIREFANEQLCQSVEVETARDALAAYMLNFVESWSGDHWINVHGFAVLDPVDEELDNIRLGIDRFASRGDAESCARLFVGMFDYYNSRGLIREGVSLARKAMELAERDAVTDNTLWGLMHSKLSVMITMLGDMTHGESLAREGLARLGQSPDDIDDLVLWALNALTIALREQGRYADAMQHAERAHALSIELGDQSFVSFTQYHIGKLAFLQHDVDRAARCLTASLSRSASAEPNETAIYSAIYLAAVRIKRGELQGAAKCLRDAEPHWRAAGPGIGRLWLYAVAALAAAGSWQVAAAQLFGSCAAIASSLGVPVVWESWTEDVKARLREDLGESEYDGAYGKGLSLGLAEAATMALEVLDEIERGVTD